MAFVLIALLGLCLAATIRLQSLWTGTSAEPIRRDLRSWWIWGDALLRGWVRALPAGLLALWCLTLALALALAYRSGIIADDSPLRILGLLFVPLVALMMISLVSMVTIMLFNQPGLLVPPPLRDQPGALK